MDIHYLLHVPFENLGSMEDYFLEKGFTISVTRLYDQETLPNVNSFDLLVIMGGPMGIYDEDQHPWLSAEKAFIKQAIDAGKKVLGICLGAQLIADVLGSAVTKNNHREIGWFPIATHPDVRNTSLGDVLGSSIDAFHWHSDTFSTPEGAVPIGSSQACACQGFIYNNQVLGLQFHLEMTEDVVRRLVKHCHEELDDTKFVQSADEIFTDSRRFDAINMTMRTVLDAFLMEN